MPNWVSYKGNWVSKDEYERLKKEEAEAKPEVRDRRPRAEREAKVKPKVVKPKVVKPEVVKVKLKPKKEKIVVKKVVKKVAKKKITKSKPKIKGRK